MSYLYGLLWAAIFVAFYSVAAIAGSLGWGFLKAISENYEATIAVGSGWILLVIIVRIFFYAIGLFLAGILFVIVLTIPLLLGRYLFNKMQSNSDVQGLMIYLFLMVVILNIAFNFLIPVSLGAHELEFWAENTGVHTYILMGLGLSALFFLVNRANVRVQNV